MAAVPSRAGVARAAFRELVLSTPHGDVSARYYPAPGARHGILLVGGVGGGWDTPAQGLYPRLCEAYSGDGSAACLRVRFRHPGALEECVVDVLAGLRFLRDEGVEAAGLVGHSFGGAVVVQAAALAGDVVAAVTLATQGYGCGPAAALGPRCALLLVHGGADEVLPPACSAQVHRSAKDPKALVLYPGAGHGLDEVAEAVHGLVDRWMREHLLPFSP